MAGAVNMMSGIAKALNVLWGAFLTIILLLMIVMFPFLGMTLVVAPESVGIMFFVSYLIIGTSLYLSRKSYRSSAHRPFLFSICIVILYFSACYAYLEITGEL